MSTMTAQLINIRCQNCPRTFDNPRAGSHSLPAPDAARVAGWAVCDTCDAQASEDWADEVPLSEEDVDAWKSDHRCEPDVRKLRPEVAV